MRTDVSSSFLDDFERTEGINASVRATIYKNRTFIPQSQVNDSALTPFGPTRNIIGRPDVCQDMKYDPYRERVAAVYSSGSKLQAQVYGNTVFDITSGGSILTDDGSRPSIQFDQNYVYIYHRRGDNGQIEVLRLNPNTFYAYNGSVMDRSVVMPFDHKVAIHAVQPNTIAYFFNDEGAVGVGCASSGSTITGGSSVWNSRNTIHSGRIFFPTFVYTDSNGYSVADLNYSAAVMNGGSEILCYYTSGSGFYGNVTGTSLLPDGTWVDFFEAVPADLSEFAISNAVIAPNGTVHLGGRFKRIDVTGAFASSTLYYLDLWGEDGRTFSLDRFTLVGIGDEDIYGSSGPPGTAWQWQMAFIQNDSASLMFLWDCGRYAYTNTSWCQAGTRAQSIEIPNYDIKGLSGSPVGEWGIKLSNGGENYVDEPLIRVGNKIILEVGLMNIAGDSWDWMTLDNSIISNRKEGETDGRRTLDITAMPETAWRTSVMTHPFYMELNSKQSLYTDADKLDNLYVVSSVGTVEVEFVVDFWDEGTLHPTEHDPGNNDLVTDDLTSSWERGIAEYPVIETLPITVKIYGWSRSGGMTHYEGGGDVPSDHNAVNDNFYPIITIKRGDQETELVFDSLGGVTYPPQTWYQDARGGLGDYPVTYTLSEANGLQVGDEISRVGVRVHNGNASDPTVFYIERLEIPEVAMLIEVSGETWEESSAISTPVPFTGPTDCAFEIMELHYGTGSPSPVWYDGSSLIDGDTFDTTGLPGTTSVVNILIHLSTQWISDHQGHIRMKYIRLDDGTSHSSAVYIRDTQPFYDGHTYRFFAPSVDATTMGMGGVPPQSDFPTPNYEQWIVVYNDDNVYNNGLYLSMEFEGPNGCRIQITGFDFDYLFPNHLLPDTVLYDVHGGCLGAPAPIVDDPTTIAAQTLQIVGTPVIMFATKPYTTFNFETSAAHVLEGEGSWGGVVGLAENAKNYIAARVSPVGNNNIQLIKVRNKKATVLIEDDYDYQAGENPLWVMMTHRDGVFKVFLRDDGYADWGEAVLEYTWTEEDGAIATSADLLHVGTYSLKDAPFVRIAGFDIGNSSTHLGAIPGRLFGTSGSGLEDFPNSGTLVIDGVKYTYTGKISISSDPYKIRGPFQCRNTGLEWNYTENGINYSGNAVEFVMYENLNNGTYWNRYSSRIMASNSYYNWLLSKTDFSAGLTTRGVAVTLRNRSRNFSPEASGDYHGFDQKMWITHGFFGLALVEDGTGVAHQEGSFAYLDRDNVVKWVAFSASSGSEDCTVEDMIEKIVHIAGGDAVFPGDYLDDSMELTPDWTAVL